MAKENKITNRISVWKIFGIVLGLVALFAAGIAVGKILHSNKSGLISHEVVSVKIKKPEQKTCIAVEKLLSQRLYDENSLSPDDHLFNAQTYALLAERGCSENFAAYKELALREIEIARALSDDGIVQDKNDAIDVIRTYRKLDMKREAEVVFDTMKKLTDPAIDFILEVEKIINE